MDKKQIVLIVLVLLITGGFLLIRHPGAQKTAVPVELSRATYQCDDGSVFDASFMSNDQLTVSVGGAAVNVAVKRDVNRLQYDAPVYSYIFTDTTAVVANKEEQSLISCAQVN